MVEESQSLTQRSHLLIKPTNMFLLCTDSQVFLGIMCMHKAVCTRLSFGLGTRPSTYNPEFLERGNGLVGEFQLYKMIH